MVSMKSLPIQAFGALLMTLLAFAPGQAAADDVTAIIEDAPPGSGLAAMDYVVQGQTITLAKGEVLVVGYLSSCITETIEGGKVTIGTERSVVVGGTITRKKVDCAGNNGLLLSEEQTQQSGVMISRSLKPLTINSLQPVFSLSSDGTLSITRQDKSGAPIEIATAGRHIIDLAEENIVLESGALYKARLGGKDLTFRIAPGAAPGKTQLLSRLLAFR
jgi:hypothetical protein